MVEPDLGDEWLEPAPHLVGQLEVGEDRLEHGADDDEDEHERIQAEGERDVVQSDLRRLSRTLLVDRAVVVPSTQMVLVQLVEAAVVLEPLEHVVKRRLHARPRAVGQLRRVAVECALRRVGPPKVRVHKLLHVRARLRAEVELQEVR